MGKNNAADGQLVVAVDLDNVVADCDPKVREIIRRISGVDLSRADVQDYAFGKALEAKGIDPRLARQIEQEAVRIFNDVECGDVGLVDGAAQGLAQLLGAGLSIVFATSRPPTSERLTRKWLREVELPCQEVVFLDDKSRLATAWSLLVDDAAHHAQAVSAAGVPVCLLDCPWNRSLPAHPLIHRVNNWPEIVRLALRLTKRLSQNP